MKYLLMVPRILLGLVYFAAGAFGLAMIFGFVQPPTDPQPPLADAFSKAMFATGYFFPMIKVTETFCGLLLLTNRATPLALVVLAPLTLNIFFFHFFLTPGFGNWFIPLVMVLTHAFLGYQNWKSFKPLFK